MNPKITIAKRHIGIDYPPYVIAELSANHNGRLDIALNIIQEAKRAGADAVKLQTYTADTMTIDHSGDGFYIADPNSLWSGRSLYELYQEAHTPWEWHHAIFARARERGIMIRKVAKTGKPLIISTGMASLAELDESMRAAREAGCKNIVLLKCTSSYPSSPENTNINTIPHMRELFDCEVGLSDHTMGCGAAVAAVALGASVIEKHFTLSRAEGGVDSAFSLEPDELQQLVLETERAWQALGRISYGPTAAEKPSLAFRRSLYAVADIAAGEKLTTENVRAIRPGYGLPPKFIYTLIGMHAKTDIPRGTALTWDLLG